MATPNTDQEYLIALKKLRDEMVTGGAITSYQIAGRSYQFSSLEDINALIESAEWKIQRKTHGIKTGVAVGRNW